MKSRAETPALVRSPISGSARNRGDAFNCCVSVPGVGKLDAHEQSVTRGCRRGQIRLCLSEPGDHHASAQGLCHQEHAVDLLRRTAERSGIRADGEVLPAKLCAQVLEVRHGDGAPPRCTGFRFALLFNPLLRRWRFAHGGEVRIELLRLRMTEQKLTVVQVCLLHEANDRGDCLIMLQGS